SGCASGGLCGRWSDISYSHQEESRSCCWHSGPGSNLQGHPKTCRRDRWNPIGKCQGHSRRRRGFDRGDSRRVGLTQYCRTSPTLDGAARRRLKPARYLCRRLICTSSTAELESFFYSVHRTRCPHWRPNRQIVFANSLVGCLDGGTGFLPGSEGDYVLFT